jgi:hypothetical protein
MSATAAVEYKPSTPGGSPVALRDLTTKDTAGRRTRTPENSDSEGDVMVTILRALKSGTGTSIGLAIAGAMLVALASVAPSTAAAADFTLELPAGMACESFDLRVEGDTNPRQVYKEFYDKNGTLVRILSAGKGNRLSFTNVATSATLELEANGSVTKIVPNSDGSQTWTVMGHNVLIFFPTDVPAGPSTTLYVGRVVFTVDASGVYTLQSTSGTSMDICAALSD